MENKGTDKIDPLLTVSDYLEITEEDNVSDDELSLVLIYSITKNLNN